MKLTIHHPQENHGRPLHPTEELSAVRDEAVAAAGTFRPEGSTLGWINGSVRTYALED